MGKTVVIASVDKPVDKYFKFIYFVLTCRHENDRCRKLNQLTQFELRKQVVRLKQNGENNAKISYVIGLSQSHCTIWQNTSVAALRPSSLEFVVVASAINAN